MKLSHILVTVIIVAALFAVVLVGLPLILKPGRYEQKAEEVTTSTPVISSTNIGRHEDVQTVKHDDHWFVVWIEGYAGGIIHHPGCPTCASKGL